MVRRSPFFFKCGGESGDAFATRIRAGLARAQNSSLFAELCTGRLWSPQTLLGVRHIGATKDDQRPKRLVETLSSSTRSAAEASSLRQHCAGRRVCTAMALGARPPGVAARPPLWLGSRGSRTHLAARSALTTALQPRGCRAPFNVVGTGTRFLACAFFQLFRPRLSTNLKAL